MAAVKVAKATYDYAAKMVKAVSKPFSDGKSGDPGLMVMSAGDIVSEVVTRVPTGFPELDEILGGGLPVGRSMEVYGPEASGKSAFVHLSIRAFQAIGGGTLLSDFEHAAEQEKLIRLGADPKAIVNSDPDSIEQAQIIWIDFLERMVAEPPVAPWLLGFDSIAAAPPKVEIGRAVMEKNTKVGAQASAMGIFFRSTNKLISRAKVCAIFVNQEREGIPKPGQFYVPPVTPGGRAAKYYASVRVRFVKVATLKDDNDKASGYLIRATTDKCRLVPPHQKAIWVIDFARGPSPELTTFHTLLQANILKSAGDKRYQAEALKSLGFPPCRRERFAELSREDPSFRQATVELSVAAVRKGLPKPGSVTDASAE